MNTINTPFKLNNLELKNRIVMSPMCQYSADKEDGIPNDWHFVHYVSRAVGGAGLVFVEMTSVAPDGRSTNQDLGIWDDAQIPAYQRIVNEVHKQGARIGLQLGHAGLKAEDVSRPVGPSLNTNPIFSQQQQHELSIEEIRTIIEQFRNAARRAVEAGFDMIGLHGAHNYLLHEFMSPGINQRRDEYGNDLAKFNCEVIEAVKSQMHEAMPLVFRISAHEAGDPGYNEAYALTLAAKFKAAGVDVFQVSTGDERVLDKDKPAKYPAYQVPYARMFKQELNVPIMAVGKLADPNIAEAALSNQDTDLVAVASGMLADPYWGLHAIQTVTGAVEPPVQYQSGFEQQ